MSLLSSLAYYTPTFEHQFLTLVLKLDDGRTPLLQTDYFRPGPDLNITIDELGSKRIGVLNGVCVVQLPVLVLTRAPGMLRQCDQLVVAASEAEPENTVLKGKSVRLSQTVTEMLRLVKAQNASQVRSTCWPSIQKADSNYVPARNRRLQRIRSCSLQRCTLVSSPVC